MAFQISKTITSWSFSRWQTYDQCPAKARYKFIDRLPEPGSPAMERGSAIHKLSEDYVKGSISKLPVELKPLASEFKALRAARRKNPALINVEESWAFRKDWTITHGRDWDGAWLRVKLDVAVRDGKEVTVNDVKTGKFRPDDSLDYGLQMKLYDLGALVMYAGIPDVRVRSRLLYVDAGMVYPPPEEQTVYTAKDLPALKKEWELRVKPMLSDTTFAPKPNRFCGWCHFRKANQGPCQY
jgi:RecB family exonuclease